MSPGRPTVALALFLACRSPGGGRAPTATEDAGATVAPAEDARPAFPRDAAPPDAMAGELPVDAAPEPDAAAPDVPVTGDVGPGPFENSLGMRFLPLPGKPVMISVWETRVRDFEAYAAATGAAIPRPEFPETALQPKASVSRQQAESFARWLTAKERADGTIAADQAYRLPTDAEWDAAIELGRTGRYPWGSAFPPPDHFANYGVSADGFTYTAPVGSFPPNRLGLHDLSGNLWEWIGQGCAAGGAYLVRGAGWNARNAPYLAADFHYCFAADLVGHHNVGFRLVLETP